MKWLSMVSAVALGIALSGCASAIPASYRTAGRQSHAGARMPDVGLNLYVPELGGPAPKVLALSAVCIVENPDVLMHTESVYAYPPSIDSGSVTFDRLKDSSSTASSASGTDRLNCDSRTRSAAKPSRWMSHRPNHSH